jgi:ketosteroid isomerase-like protein
METPPNGEFVCASADFFRLPYGRVMRVAASIFFAAAITAVAQEPSPSPSPESAGENPEQALQRIVELEAKFVAMGHEQGSRAAFLHFLAPDAIAFEPGPQNARKIWENREPDEVSLAWRPVFAAISASSDIAYTSGPSEWREKKSDEKPFGNGRYITIWKRQKDGEWKVALDVGVQVPGPPKTEEELELSLPNEAPPDKTKSAKQLREVEAEFLRMAKTDSTDALMHAADQNIRVYREGMYPAAGRAAAGLMLSVRRGALLLHRLGGDTSAAGDLVYHYGRYSLKRVEHAERGHYLQIWRINRDGAWKLALDYQAPLPPEEKK